MTNEPIETEVVPQDQSQAIQVRPNSEISVSQGQKPVITAAQAKVEAIANLTMAAYQKAATLELTSEESAALQADFPDEAFQPGAAGKEHLIYIEHAHLRDRFNAVFGMGKWAIVPRNRWAEPFRTQKGDEGSRVYVEAMLVVRGCFVGEAVGAMEYYPHNANQNYGDAVEGAKTAAFRRCAKEFGVGLQAWKKEFCDAWWKRRRGGRDFSKRPPTAPEQPKPTVSAPSRPKHKSPTEKTRLWMLTELSKQGLGDSAQEYFSKLQNPTPLMPGEFISDLRLIFVPDSREELASLIAKVRSFADGNPPEPPYPWHYDAEDQPKTAKAVLPKATEPETNQADHVFGAIEAISQKKGGTEDKPWTRYGIKVGEEWFNTFSSTIADAAKELKKSGGKVKVFYLETKYGKDATAIQMPDGRMIEHKDKR